MNTTPLPSASLTRLNRFVLVVALGWTILFGCLLVWNYQLIQREMLAQARREASGSLSKDLLYRKWFRQHGGVYVPVSGQSQPNQYLSHVPERDVTTPSGRVLTLLNSSSVGRQIQKMASDSGDLIGHNTSVTPLNPSNAADAWEAQALRTMENGPQEVASVEAVGGRPHLRLIRPLRMEERCMNCHSHQGYKVGDIRGGVSVSVPLASYIATARSQMMNRLAGHGIIWMVGVTGLWVGRARVRRGIVETIAAEVALKESEARNRAIVEAIPDIIFRIGEDGTFLDCHASRRHHLMMPPEEFLGKKVADVLPPALAEQVEQNLARAIESGEVQIFCYHLPVDSGQRHFEGRMVTTGRGEVLAIVRDITEHAQAEEERLELERRLLHSQKLESLGVLAGGIAHDFNNLLMIILGNLELAHKGIEPANPSRERIDCAMKAAHRSAELTRQMLAYSGKVPFKIGRVDLGDLVEENIHLLKSTMPKNVSLNLHLHRPLSVIKADAAQLHQVIMNLVTNAWEACGEGQGGISVTTGEGDFDDCYLSRSRLQEVPPAGRFVYLDVDDTGCGMDGETQRCLFDPFFTTKFTGRGLGMSAILGIVKGHGGAIMVNSELGQGSVIRVLFPVPEELRATNITEEAASVPGPAVLRGGTVLVVDDEEMVKDICKKMLEFLGHSVITAADGVEAVEAFRLHGAELGCVLLDLSMPNMDGLTAFREMKALRADVRVVLSSGFSEKVATDRFAGEGLAGFIQKPYELEKLQQALDRALAR